MKNKLKMRSFYRWINKRYQNPIDGKDASEFNSIEKFQTNACYRQNIADALVENN